MLEYGTQSPIGSELLIGLPFNTLTITCSPSGEAAAGLDD